MSSRRLASRFQPCLESIHSRYLWRAQPRQLSRCSVKRRGRQRRADHDDLFDGDLFLILPELLVITAACIVLVLDPVLRPSNKDGLVWLSLGTLAICMGLTASQMSAPSRIFSGLVVIDAYGAFWKLLLYFVTGLTVLLSHSYLKEERLYFGEYYGFVLLSLSGMMVMVSSADLLTLYLGTELMSLSLYVMAGLKRSEPRSLEASAKYFVLGAFHRAFSSTASHCSMGRPEAPDFQRSLRQSPEIWMIHYSCSPRSCWRSEELAETRYTFPEYIAATASEIVWVSLLGEGPVPRGWGFFGG